MNDGITLSRPFMADHYEDNQQFIARSNGAQFGIVVEQDGLWVLMELPPEGKPLAQAPTLWELFALMGEIITRWEAGERPKPLTEAL